MARDNRPVKHPETEVQAVAHKVLLPKVLVEKGMYVLLYRKHPVPAGARNSRWPSLVGDAELTALSALASHEDLNIQLVKIAKGTQCQCPK